MAEENYDYNLTTEYKTMYNPLERMHESFPQPTNSSDGSVYKSPVNRDAKSDMQEKIPAQGSDRYGGGDLPSRMGEGDNEREYRSQRY